MRERQATLLLGIKIKTNQEDIFGWENIMLTIKLDSNKWLKEIVAQFFRIKNTSRALPDLAEFRAKFPKQNISAGDFCRTMREEERY
jgi:hypothetical protein